MNHHQMAQFAVMCLEELDAHAGQPVSFMEISRKQGIPLAVCTRILLSFNRAGIVELAGVGKVVLARPVEDLTALEILEAVWRRDSRPDFRMQIGGPRGVRRRKTLEAVRWSQTLNIYPSENGPTAA